MLLLQFAAVNPTSEQHSTPLLVARRGELCQHRTRLNVQMSCTSSSLARFSSSTRTAASTRSSCSSRWDTGYHWESTGKHMYVHHTPLTLGFAAQLLGCLSVLQWLPSGLCVETPELLQLWLQQLPDSAKQCNTTPLRTAILDMRT